MPGQGTGGAGEHWGAVFPRFLPDIFTLLTSTREKYGAKRLPADHAVVDWGISWKEIEPYYTRADKLVGSSGKAGNLQGKLIDGGNIFEGPRSEDTRTPPTKMPYTSLDFCGCGKIARLSSLSKSGGHSYSRSHQSRRITAARMFLLRVLRPFWLHGRCESAAHEYSAAHRREAKKRHAAQWLHRATDRL